MTPFLIERAQYSPFPSTTVSKNACRLPVCQTSAFDANSIFLTCLEWVGVARTERRRKSSRIGRMVLSNRSGQQGNVYQPRNLGTWNPQLPAYGRFWMQVPGGERKRKTIPLGRCGAKWIACLRLREYMACAGVCRHASHDDPVPGTTFRQQAERWIVSISTRRRRPVKPSTLFGWQHCLDRWILPTRKPTPLAGREPCSARVCRSTFNCGARTENHRQRGRRS